jgi:CheY-like chemotaxis protein
MPPHEKTVLVVDDEEALCNLAAKLIEKRGYQVGPPATAAKLSPY